METETGMFVLAVQRGRRWMYRPRGRFELQGGDRVISVGPEEGAEALDALRRVSAPDRLLRRDRSLPCSDRGPSLQAWMRSSTCGFIRARSRRSSSSSRTSAACARRSRSWAHGTSSSPCRVPTCSASRRSVIRGIHRIAGVERTMTAPVVPGDVYALPGEGTKTPIPMQAPGPACFVHVKASPGSASRLADTIAEVEEVSAVAMIAGDHDLIVEIPSCGAGGARHREPDPADRGRPGDADPGRDLVPRTRRGGSRPVLGLELRGPVRPAQRRVRRARRRNAGAPRRDGAPRHRRTRAPRATRACAIDEVFGRATPRSSRPTTSAPLSQPGRPRSRRRPDTPGCRLAGDLGQPDRVRGVLRADHEHHVGAARELLDRVLPILGRVADVLARRPLDGGEPVPEHLDDLRRSRRPTASSGSGTTRVSGRAAGPSARRRGSGPGSSRSGAWPLVPSTSSWPAWPISTIVRPSAANRRASRCTFVTSGQVASRTVSPRRSASAKTAGGDPVGRRTTTAPSGTSSTSSTKTAPCASRSRTTWALWTICLRT